MSLDTRPDVVPDTARTSTRPPATRRIGARLRAPALALVVPLALVGLWQWAATAGFYNAAQLPPPLAVAEAFTGLVERGEMWSHLGISLQRVLLGFAWGTVIGVAVGGVVGLVTPARLLLAPTVQAVRAVPSLAWVPLLVLWLGIGEAPKVVLIAIGAFFPVYTTVSSALAHQDRHLVEVGRAYGLRGVGLFARVLLPAAAPSVLAGLRLALAQSWLFVVAAELIASTMGLGFLLTHSQNTGRTDILLLAIVLLAVCGKTTDALLGAVERRVAATR
ncbi:ABC transporter permease [Nocardiopsis sp. MG754419]|uniref:ABC transporter permease n=1 Tax=Nocardiopsis sp. MG754419 TaxID=2259865 RepID=UPI001BA957C9|nr:ABC transporter permease [Nocardiopsis sp. MG754419]MBR8743926.1 ABC transporter permease [Nocardiopsis sp. MG754419]